MKKFSLVKIAGVVVSTGIASSAFADTAAAIAAAQTEGVSNVTLAVTAVVAIAACAFGLSLIRGLISR